MTHEFDGKKYAKASAHQKEWGASIIAELSLKGTERVLDLGCGDGALTSHFADLLPNGEAVGIDASQGMIAVALEKERSNLRFLLHDIDNLDFTDEFDIVFSNAALHWIKDHHKLLQNVRRALRAGGTIRFNFAADGNCSNFFKVVREAMALDRYRFSFPTSNGLGICRRPMSMRQLLNRVGCGISKCGVKTQTDSFQMPRQW